MTRWEFVDADTNLYCRWDTAVDETLRTQVRRPARLGFLLLRLLMGRGDVKAQLIQELGLFGWRNG